MLVKWGIRSGRRQWHRRSMVEVDLPKERSKLIEEIVPSIRTGHRPRTDRILPHRQLDQLPPASVFQRLIELCNQTPGIGIQESRMSGPDTLALWISSESALGPAQAFIDDHEFCHVHGLPEGSLHLTLPLDIARRAISLGWAEQHILARSGLMPQTLLMVYAPRDEHELEVVWGLVMTSLNFAWGKIPE
jgi:Family of unknown function (DUF5519)